MPLLEGTHVPTVEPNAETASLVNISLRQDKRAIAAAQAGACAKLRAEAKAARKDAAHIAKTNKQIIARQAKIKRDAVNEGYDDARHTIAANLKVALVDAKIEVFNQFKQKYEDIASGGVLAITVGAKDRLAKGIV